MIEFIDRYFVHEDNRGIIEGLINTGKWGEINFIVSLPGTVRGNHYHKNTTELFIILDGCVEVFVQKVENNKVTGVEESVSVTSGDVFKIKPNVNHVFKVIHSSQWLNILSKPIDPSNPDIHKVGN